MELTHFKVITCNTAKLENAEVDTSHEVELHVRISLCDTVGFFSPDETE